MLNVVVKDEGARLSLGRVLNGVKNRIPLLKKIGFYVVRKHSTDLQSGVDADGAPLAPVTPWTRVVSADRGRSASRRASRPLLNTGQMRASITIKNVTNNAVTVGFHGKQAEKAEAMQRGIPGRMRVAEKGVRGLYSGVRQAKSDGHKFARINIGSGWITKQVSADNTIAIRPRARKFYYIGSREVTEILRIARDYVDRLTAKA